MLQKKPFLGQNCVSLLQVTGSVALQNVPVKFLLFEVRYAELLLQTKGVRAHMAGPTKRDSAPNGNGRAQMPPRQPAATMHKSELSSVSDGRANARGYPAAAAT